MRILFAVGWGIDTRQRRYRWPLATRACMKTAVAAAGLLLLSSLAGADVLYPDAITFGPSYVAGPPAGTPWIGGAELGTPLLIAGTVTTVQAPFADLLPGGVFEMTFVFEGATCTGGGMWDDLTCQRGGTFMTFGGGTMSMFLDATPDADFTDLDSFRDGELVLQAGIQLIDITDDDPIGFCPTEDYPDVRMLLSFIGGSWYHRVAPGTVSFGEGEIPGPYPDMIPEALRAIGYVLRVDGNLDVFGPVATKPTTWGRVKAMYR